MDKEINVLAIMKGEEQYVFLYDDRHKTETLRMLGRYAADPQLSFSWYDAAVLSKKIRDIAAEQEAQQLASTLDSDATNPILQEDAEEALLESIQQETADLLPPLKPQPKFQNKPRFSFRHEQDTI